MKMKAIITYRIKLKDDVLVARLAGDANTVISNQYLPGSVLRGALLKNYCHDHNIRNIDCRNESLRKIFFSNNTRFLNGYPVEAGKRSLPVPRSWQTEKGEKSPIYDFSVKRPANVAQWKAIGSPFFVFSGTGKSLIKLVKPEMHTTIHITRGIRQIGNPDVEEGTIFRYISLNKGQIFEAAILCDEDLLKNKSAFFPHAIHIGKSRTGGYGTAELVSETIEEPEFWREPDCKPQIKSSSREFTLTLLSDAIIRNDQGQSVVDVNTIAGQVSQILNAGIKPVGERIFITGYLTGGFNSKWGLPVSQEWATAMGSTFVFESGDNIDVEKFSKLEWEGIGERRMDGFGRIAINWLFESQWECDFTITKIIDSDEKIFDEETPEYKISSFMVNRMFAEKIDEKITSQSNLARYKIRGMRPNQLNRLIQILQNLRFREYDKGVSEITKYSEHIKARQITRQQFENIKIDNEILLDWICVLIKKPEEIWKTLGLESDDQKLSIAGVEPDRTEILAYETTLRFIIRILGRAVKEIQQKES
jgi:CRISPR-associated protein Csx10